MNIIFLKWGLLMEKKIMLICLFCGESFIIVVGEVVNILFEL